MAQQINTIIVLRNDQTTNWEQSSHVMLRGEVGIGYLENGNVIAKLGDGEHSWKDLPQIEGVFEDDVILTYNFGRHATSNGFVNAGGKGMTTSEWLIDALSVTQNPTITQPTSSLSASCTGSGSEIGTKITKINWDGSSSFGSYTYGPSTGLGASNRTWAISCDQTEATSTSEDGSFTVDIQLTQEAEKTYATVTGTCEIDATNAAYAKNNVGATTSLRVSSHSKTHTASAKASAYRKPFYGVLTPANVVDVNNLTSAIVRGLPNSGSKTKGLPTAISVPAGSQMVIFAARAGAYSSLTATDDKAMNATVGFTKVANAVKVEGANGFDATFYDIWYVDWQAGIGAAKQLTLKWA